METMAFNAVEKEVDDLIKYKTIFDNASAFTGFGLYAIVIGSIMWLFGPALGNNFGNLLGETGPFLIGLGILALLVAFPIKVVNEPKYQDAVERTQLDSVNTPEQTKTALFSYLRNQRYGKKTGRISCVLELITEVSGDDSMDVITTIIDDQTYDDPVRSSAVWELEKKSSKDQERAIQILIKYLKQDPSAKVRSSAASALGNQKSP